MIINVLGSLSFYCRPRRYAGGVSHATGLLVFMMRRSLVSFYMQPKIAFAKLLYFLKKSIADLQFLSRQLYFSFLFSKNMVQNMFCNMFLKFFNTRRGRPDTGLPHACICCRKPFICLLPLPHREALSLLWPREGRRRRSIRSLRYRQGRTC